MVASDSDINIERAKALHDRQPVVCVRAVEDFWLFLTAAFATPWAAFNESGEMVGYLVVDHAQERFTEIFAENDEILMNMVRTWLYQQQTEYVKILLAPWQEKAARKLGMIADDFCLKDSENFRIFHWEKVVGCFLEVKMQMAPLIPGNLRIGIEDYGTLDITVEDGKVTCRKTDLEADVNLDAFTASRVMFGHCPIQYVTDIASRKKMLMDTWFPLPLCWMIQNHV